MKQIEEKNFGPAGKEFNPLEEKIINQAAKNFTEKGFRKVTLDKIASDLGISKKTLYKFFKSKEELIEAVIHTIEQRMIQSDQEIMKDSISWEEKINKIVFAPKGLRKQENIFLEELIHFYPNDFKRLAERKKNLIKEIIQQEIRNGAIRSEIDPQILIMIFMNVLEHLFIGEEFLYENKLNMMDTLEQVGDILLNGIKTKG